MHGKEGAKKTFSQKLCYEALCSNLSLSATIAMNSELVGFAFVMLTVYPNSEEMESIFPLLHATSMAWRMARSTRLAVVLNFWRCRDKGLL